MEEIPFGHFQLADPALPGTEELANLFAGFNSSVTNAEAQVCLLRTYLFLSYAFFSAFCLLGLVLVVISPSFFLPSY